MSNSIVSYKGSDWSLLEETNSYIQKPPIIEREFSDTCYPSNASAFVNKGGISVLEGACNRAMFYRLTKVPITNPSGIYSAYINEHGKYLEEMLVAKWKEMGIWINNNVKFFTEKHGFPLSGEVDAFIRHPKCINPKPKDLYLIEVKSFYKYFKKVELIGNKTKKGYPAYNNLFQIMLYLDYYASFGITKGKLVYTSRDEATQAEFDIKLVSVGGKTYASVDDEVDTGFCFEDIINRYKDAWRSYKANDLPPRDFKLYYDEHDVEKMYAAGQLTKTKYNDFMSGKQTGAWQCSLCYYRDHCWGEESPKYERFFNDD